MWSGILYLYVHNNPINHIDPQGLAGEGFAYAWLSQKLDDWSNNAGSPALAMAASFASQGLQMAAGLDQTYTGVQRAQRDIQNYQTLGFKGALQASISDAYDTVKEGAGTTDLVRAFDYENQYSRTEQFIYGWSGVGKSFLAVLGGDQATRAMTAPKSPPPLPSAALAETTGEGGIVRVQHATSAEKAVKAMREQTITSTSDSVYGVIAEQPGKVMLTQEQFLNAGAKVAEKAIEFDVPKLRLYQNPIGDVEVPAPVDLSLRNPVVLDVPKN